MEGSTKFCSIPVQLKAAGLCGNPDLPYRRVRTDHHLAGIGLLDFDGQHAVLIHHLSVILLRDNTQDLIKRSSAVSLWLRNSVSVNAISCFQV